MKKIFGTTLLLGQRDIETIYGKFVSVVFQDTILKTYVIALIYCDTWNNMNDRNFNNNDEVYIRIHSSCVTSEMLCSQDCDCVQQLFGAIKKISDAKSGILFYLIQEGRGCGYISKARACQLVQYDELKGNKNINTFEAYSLLGLKPDYRSYHNIKEILHILGIESLNFILLTNNPDKLLGLKELNINIYKTENIEYEPNPFNLSYLISKGKFGHDLHLLKNSNVGYTFPYQPILPFEPFNLEKYSRFIYVASYYLPIKNMYNWFYIPNLNKDSELYTVINKFSHPLNKNLFNINDETAKKFNINDPLWFRVYLYYDITTNLDYIVLEYK
jgi:3,4-dihydroxy 2-butanone 4-phosphate synthase/GTP cyclohydrolase II